MVTLVVRKLDVLAEQPSYREVNVGGANRRYVDRGDVPRVELEIKADVFAPEGAELAGLLDLGIDQLEVVIRQRAPTPQQIQSEAEPAPWRVTPQKSAKAVKKPADVPETQPEPEEPGTAQLVEEFGSWG